MKIVEDGCYGRLNKGFAQTNDWLKIVEDKLS